MDKKKNTFFSKEELKIIKSFKSKGYIIKKVINKDDLDYLMKYVVEFTAKFFNFKKVSESQYDWFLNNFHKKIKLNQLNIFRIKLYESLNSKSWFRPLYYNLAKTTLDTLVGNELAMQNMVNLSIQLPKDKTSLIDTHSDIFTGETPFQVVAWLPLVNVERTKSMFINNIKFNMKVFKKFSKYSNNGLNDVFKKNKNQFEFLKVNFGEILIFSPILLHGNVKNITNETRWSFNTRFTGVFTPYTETPGNQKNLGNFYSPINLRPVSHVGLNYKDPLN